MISELSKNYMLIFAIIQIIFTITVIIYKGLSKKENNFIWVVIMTISAGFFVTDLFFSLYVPEFVAKDFSESKCPGYFESKVELSETSARLICEYPYKDIEIHMLNSEEIDEYTYGNDVGFTGALFMGVLWVFLLCYIIIKE